MPEILNMITYTHADSQLLLQIAFPIWNDYYKLLSKALVLHSNSGNRC